MRQAALRLAAGVTRPARVRLAAARHERALRPVLRDSSLWDRVAAGKPLPAGYGRRLSERAVEYPWALGAGLAGDVLDAGGTLNHSWVVAALPDSVRSLHVVTLAPEPTVDDPRIVYSWADLRSIPLPAASVDTAACLSTLEHVGMDNRGYGAAVGRAAEPRAEARRVLGELRRVLRPGGRALVTVPYGAQMEIGSMRQFTRADVEDCVSAWGHEGAEVTVFAYGDSGWSVSSLEDAAGLRYRDRFAELAPADGAVAARAVACMRLPVPAA
jgi:SAM-dependent methyltransferase